MFVRGRHIARKIVQWERLWVSIRKISDKKDRSDGDSCMYDDDVNNAAQEFARVQEGSKYN